MVRGICSLIPFFRRASFVYISTGEIVHISAAGIPMIFLNDLKAYNDLLHNRGDIYSDKPRMVMTGELCGAEYMVRLGPLSNLLYVFAVR